MSVNVNADGKVGASVRVAAERPLEPTRLSVAMFARRKSVFGAAANLRAGDRCGQTGR